MTSVFPPPATVTSAVAPDAVALWLENDIPSDRPFGLDASEQADAITIAIENEKALELHDRAGGAEQIAATADVRLRCGRDIEIHRRRVEHGGRHLRRHEALPDELIELELI